MLVGFDKGYAHWGWDEGLCSTLFECIVSLLDSFDVLMDCSISSDTVLIHLRNKVCFTEQGRWFGFAIGHRELWDEFLTFIDRRQNGV